MKESLLSDDAVSIEPARSGEMASDGAGAPAPWTIEPWSGGLRPRAREIWQYRRLTLFFGLQALEKQYARTKLGWLWLFIRPLFPLCVKTLIFGGLLAVGSDGVPYFLFLVTASAVWELFANALVWGTRSLELNRSLLKQLYTPRLILPLAMMTPAFLTFVIYLAVLAAAAGWFAVSHGRSYLVFGPQLLWTPLAAAMAVMLAFAIALWTSVPALVARDVRFTVNYVLGFWIFLTPVMYPMSAVPPKWSAWIAFNPMAPIVEAFKFGLLGVGRVEPWQLGVSGGVILAVLVGGLFFFARAEADAADRV